MRDASVLRNGARVRCEDPKWPGVGTIVAAIFEVSWDDGLLVRHAAETLRGVEDPRTEPAVVSVRQIGGEQGPWRLFVGDHGVATWPSQAANEDPEHYAKEVARCVRLALQRSGDPLHPNGRCTCCGEGHCEWCQRVDGGDRPAPMSCGWCVTGVDCPRHPATGNEVQRGESPGPTSCSWCWRVLPNHEAGCESVELAALRKVAEAARAFRDAIPCVDRSCAIGPDLVSYPAEQITCEECRALVILNEALAASESSGGLPKEVK